MLKRVLCVITALLAIGCQSESTVKSERTVDVTGRLMESVSRLPVVKAVSEWEVPAFVGEEDSKGLVITTAHYVIYTTMEDPLILRQVPMFVESAYRSYSELMGMVPTVKERLAMYLFKSREQWEAYTKYHMGAAAEMYLKIQSGAYFANGKCIAYHLGRKANFSILAHEGWHQFSHTLFAYHLPSWVDEGMATNFESYEWKPGQVRFEPWRNGGRLMSLKQALAGGKLFSLDELLGMDPGMVVGHMSSGNGGVNPTATYYAQVYALVRFLREEDYGRYLISLRQLLDEGYEGRWPIDEPYRSEASEKTGTPSRRWNAAVGRYLFERFFSAPGGEIEQQYRAFCQKIAYTVSAKK